MPLQYPSSTPYNPYTEPKAPQNWPKIILISLGVIVVILLIIFVIIPNYKNFFSGGKSGDELNNNETPSYDCSDDIYNCADFETQAEAQDVYDYCFETVGDVHQLDRDGNRKACESLG